MKILLFALPLAFALSACCESTPEGPQSPDASASSDVGAPAPSAEKSLDDKCLLGDPVACAERGRELRDGKGARKDSARAHELFELACQGDELDACIDLGRSHLKTRSRKRDPRSARKAFKKACDGKRPDGCYELGHLYGSGEGGPPDQAHAIRLYYRACKAGHKEACLLAK